MHFFDQRQSRIERLTVGLPPYLPQRFLAHWPFLPPTYLASTPRHHHEPGSKYEPC